jgi:hypothetical protein
MLNPQAPLLRPRSDLSSLPPWLRWLMIVAVVGAAAAIGAVVISNMLAQ